MQIRNRTFFIADNVSMHYRRRFMKAILAIDGRVSAQMNDRVNYIILDAEKPYDGQISKGFSPVKITVNEMVSILDAHAPGEMKAFWVDGGVLLGWFPESYRGTVLKIPEGVKRISSDAFKPLFPHLRSMYTNKAKSITKLELPDTLEVIEPDAFRNFKALEEISGGDNIREFGGFRGCVSLREIRIPEACETIGDHAFHGCRRLWSVIWNMKLKSVGEYAFSVTPLHAFESYGSLETVAENAFSGSPYLSYAWLAGKNITCAKGAFKGTGVTKLAIEAETCTLAPGCFSADSPLAQIEAEAGEIIVSPRTFGAEAYRQGLKAMRFDDIGPDVRRMWENMIRKYGYAGGPGMVSRVYSGYFAMCMYILGVPEDLSQKEKLIRKEAYRRLRTFVTESGLNPNVPRYYKAGRIYYSYLTASGFMGSVDTIEYDPEYVKIAKEAEKLYGIHVYHAVESYAFGHQLVLLYVGNIMSDWPEERPEDGYVLAYVYDFGLEEGEFGTVVLSSFQGALERTG